MSRKLTGKFITTSFARKLIGLPGKTASARNRCIGGQLRGRKFGNRQDQIEAFRSAAATCRGKR